MALCSTGLYSSYSSDGYLVHLYTNSMEEPAVLSYRREGGGGAMALRPLQLWPDHLLVIGYLSEGCLMVMQTRRYI